MSERKKYGFSPVKKGGFVRFDGVMSSSKEATSVVVDKTAGTVTVNFADGHVYKYSAAVTETSNGYSITDETEEWT